jgi:ABC-type branched-subunit amino acid transport system ATPase component
VSIQIVAVAVIGGLGSVVGAVLGALWVVGLPVLLGGSPEVTLVTSGAGLLILLMYFPGGLVQLVETGRGALLQRLARDLPPEPPRERPVIAVAAGRERDAVAPGAIALRAEALTVRFGGNVAVDGMSLELRAGEIVGLIGANGAGKTTLMNAIGGFVPASGQVWLFDHELTGRSPAERARLGLGRAFQNAELFAELTVRETVQVALERRLPTSLLGTVLGTRGAARRERQQRAEADELIDFLGLGRYADAMVGNLSTGTRRITELSCLLALDARVVCLDEPTAGVAQRETEAFGPLLREIRAEFDSSMLIIEHDMPLVLSVSDRVYCMELGREIAQGSPDAVREDPAVIASYLGTDDRAILRSGPR